VANPIILGAGIKLDGEADFNKAVASISKNQAVLASEMKKVTAEFANNADSIKATAAKTEEYNRQIAVQENKVNLLRAALENARNEYGENSNKVKDWQIKLNNAEAQLSGLKNQLDNTNDELNQSDTALTKAGDSAEKSGEKFSRYGDVMKGVGVAMGAVVVAAGAAAVKLGQEVVQQFGELEQNLGGSEAVFGEYAASIQKTG
jgi:chromosome segregation ATPase